jgi:hypothetical protein
VVATLTDHPTMPAGYNADPIDGDEVDGSGTNWTIWPVLFDTFIGLVPLVITPEMMDAFLQECADLVLPWEDNIVAVPPDRLDITLRPEIQEVAASGDADKVAWKRRADTVVLQPDGAQVTAGGEPETITLADEEDTDTVRKAG